jgi:hypothetical protein
MDGSPVHRPSAATGRIEGQIAYSPLWKKRRYPAAAVQTNLLKMFCVALLFYVVLLFFKHRIVSSSGIALFSCLVDAVPAAYTCSQVIFE